MNVITAHPSGGPDVLRIARRPVPSPGPGEVLIKVHAAGVNGADRREREGKYPVPSGAPLARGARARELFDGRAEPRRRRA